MTKREMLLEQLEETAFALMMEEVAKEEGKKALEENERLKADDSFIVPESTYRKGIVTIKRYFSQKNRQPVMRTVSKVVSRVAVIVLMLLLFATAFATIPELRSRTLNLIIEVFDDRTRIEFGEEQSDTSVSNSLVNWVPDGFELVDRGESVFSVWEKYNDSDGAFMEINIYFGEGVACEMDTEDARIEYCEIRGCPATMDFKKDAIRLTIPVMESKRVYYIQSEGVDGNAVLRVAESMTIR